MPTTIMSNIQLVAALGVYDVRPPAGEDWEVSEFGSSAFVGVAPAGVPEIDAGIYDGVNGPANIVMSTDIRGWYRKQRIFINNTNYLRLTNPNGGAGRNLSFSAKVAVIFGPTGTSMVVSDVQQIATTANMDVRPPAGEDWLITDVGASLWVGGAPLNIPDVTVSIFDGTNAAIVMHGADARGWTKELELHINNTNYLRLTNTNALNNFIGVSGVVSRIYGPTGVSMVISDVQVAGAGANVDFRPPVGEEWQITEIGAGTFVGVAPAALPDLTVSLFNGTIASIIANNANVKQWNNAFAIYTDNTNYLRINDSSGAGQNIAISGVIMRNFMS